MSLSVLELIMSETIGKSNTKYNNGAFGDKLIFCMHIQFFLIANFNNIYAHFFFYLTEAIMYEILDCTTSYNQEGQYMEE